MVSNFFHSQKLEKRSQTLRSSLLSYAWAIVTYEADTIALMSVLSAAAAFIFCLFTPVYENEIKLQVYSTRAAFLLKQLHTNWFESHPLTLADVSLRQKLGKELKSAVRIRLNSESGAASVFVRSWQPDLTMALDIQVLEHLKPALEKGEITVIGPIKAPIQNISTVLFAILAASSIGALLSLIYIFLNEIFFKKITGIAARQWRHSK